MTTSNDRLNNGRGDRTNLGDWQGVGDMVAIATEQVLEPVEGMHRAISGRWFGVVDRRVAPESRVVDGLTAASYRTVRRGGVAVGATIAAVSELASDHMALPPVWETAKGRYVQSIFNGVWGDRLEREGSPAQIKLGVREPDGSPIPITAASLSLAFPNPTDRLAVMLHGFGETERCWRSDEGTTMAAELEGDGFTVLGLRYNTGRAVSDNGSDLADLLESLRSLWPVPIDEIALIGHSMGGLVAQTALVHAKSSGLGWIGLATHLVAIGTPHLGTPIEKAVHRLSESLSLFKETRPLAHFLESRSAGIKDLRFGSNHRPVGVKYHVVAGAITREPNEPLGVLVGDLVVRVNSAIGRGRQTHDPSSNLVVLGGQNHASLIHDPETICHIRRWLAPTR